MKHYETLGLQPDATPKDIKRAFRAKSMAAHPDREGGSHEAMAEVNRAYEVLSNPERRAQYDQTGDDKPQASIRDQATGVLADLFAKALEHDENVVSVARRSIEGAREEARARLEMIKRKVAALQSRRDKIRVKDGEVNLAHAIIDGQVVQANNQVQQIERHLEIMAEVRKMLDAYESSEAAMVVRTHWGGSTTATAGSTW